MKVTFYSNYLNHHQIPFCNAMYELLGDGFTFVETEPMEQERLEQGWSFDKTYPYHLKSYQDTKSYDRSVMLASDSDIIIHGSAPEAYMKIRMKTGKPAFRYSERLFRRGLRTILNPRTMRSYLMSHTRYRHHPLYMLCASAYTTYDCKRIFAYPDKCFKWGYFTQAKGYDIEALLDSKNKTPVKILWAGRFMRLKHPEAAIEVARYLSGKNIDYTLDYIGDGECSEQIQQMAKSESGCIRFLGSMNPSEVRCHMESADIFLFTSDFQEEWGAVLNEAMNSGCAVVASHAAGSVRFLLKHGVNGFIYESGNIASLCHYTEMLAKDLSLCHRFGTAAYETIAGEWSPECAAQRLLTLCDRILTGECSLAPFASGPCSKASIIKHQYNIL